MKTLSIITVTFRDPAGLSATLDSVRQAALDNEDVEVIVIDGASGGETDAILRANGSWIVAVSEPDKGIYDAMNKGLAMSAGDHVWFLNGGDTARVEKWDQFLKELRAHPGEMLLYGYELVAGSRSSKRRPRPGSYIWHALPTSHQAIVYPGVLARQVKYETEYFVTGDYAFTARLIRAGVRSVRRSSLISRFVVGGFSQESGATLAQQARQVQERILGTPKFLQGASAAIHYVSRMRRNYFSRGGAH